MNDRNRNKIPEGVDAEKIWLASQKARFFQDVIRIVTVIILFVGFICGIVLYKFVLSDDASNKKQAQQKTVDGGKKPGGQAARPGRSQDAGEVVVEEIDETTGEILAAEPHTGATTASMAQGVANATGEVHAAAGKASTAETSATSTQHIKINHAADGRSSTAEIAATRPSGKHEATGEAGIVTTAEVKIATATTNEAVLTPGASTDEATVTAGGRTAEVTATTGAVTGETGIATKHTSAEVGIAAGTDETKIAAKQPATAEVKISTTRRTAEVKLVQRPATAEVKIAATRRTAEVKLVPKPATAEVRVRGTGRPVTGKTQAAQAPPKQVQAISGQQAAPRSTAEVRVAAPPRATPGNTTARSTTEVNTAAKPPVIKQPPPPIKYFDVDTASIELSIGAGEYTAAIATIESLLAKKDINDRNRDWLNLAAARIKFFAPDGGTGAAEFAAKIKYPYFDAYSYAIICVKLFSRSSPATCAQIVDAIFSSSAISLSDAHKLDIARECATAGMKRETEKALSNVVAASDNEAEMNEIKKILAASVEKSTPAYNTNPYSKTFFTPDSGKVFGMGESPAAVVNEEFLRSDRTLSHIFFRPGDGGTLFALAADGELIAMDPASGRLVARGKSPGMPARGTISWLFNIQAFAPCVLAFDGAQCSRAGFESITGGTPFTMPLPVDRTQVFPYMVSPDSKRIVKIKAFSPDRKEATIDMYSLPDARRISSRKGVAVREPLTGFADFSSEIKKYSVESVIESRYFYYFCEDGAATGPVSATRKLRLFAQNLETGDEKPLITVRTDDAASLCLNYSCAATAAVISFRGTLSGPAGDSVKAGTWVFDQTFSGGTRLSYSAYRSVASRDKRGDPAVPVEFFALEPSGRDIRKLTVARRAPGEIMRCAAHVAKARPAEAAAMLEAFAAPDKTGTVAEQAERAKLAAEVSRITAELRAAGESEALAAARIAARMGLHRTAFERAGALAASKPSDGRIADAAAALRDESKKAMETNKEKGKTR